METYYNQFLLGKYSKSYTIYIYFIHLQEFKTQNKVIPNYAEALVDFAIEVANAMSYKRLPAYDEMYGILDRVLYPEGDHSQPIVFSWLSDEEKEIASKIPIVSIQSIQFDKRSAKRQAKRAA